MEIDSSTQKRAETPFSTFGNMNSLLANIEHQTNKKLSHQERQNKK